MVVDDEAIESAILGIFFELHLPSEGRLAYTALQSEWPKQNFRANDLDPGLIRLLQRRYLRMADEGAVRMVVLTKAGYEHGESFGSVATIVRDSLVWLGRTLGFATPRQQRSSRGNARRHRATDEQGAMDFVRGAQQH